MNRKHHNENLFDTFHNSKENEKGKLNGTYLIVKNEVMSYLLPCIFKSLAQYKFLKSQY